MRATECSRQKAPSAKRCIKTGHPEAVDGDLEWVRKHRAPNGALRLVMQIMSCFVIVRVRKHRAPKGALRLFLLLFVIRELGESESTERQKVH